MFWLVTAVLILVWFSGYLWNRGAIRRYNRTGNPHEAVVLFAEPVRWLGIIWGFAGFCRGLRRAQFGGYIELVRWSSFGGAVVAFPDLTRRGRALRKADRLARRIEQLAGDYPGSPFILVGYSSGSFIVLEACRRIEYPEVIEKVILLSSSVSPRYPLKSLIGCVRRVHTFHSMADMITGIGPLLVGCNDRRFSPAAGTLGFRGPPAFVTQHAWRPRHIRLGYLGDHFTICSPRFVEHRIAPLLNGSNGRTASKVRWERDPLQPGNK